MLKKLFAAIGVGSLIALGGAVAAQADVTVTLTADPSTVVIGEESTLTATGLEDGAIVIFSTPDTPVPVITPAESTVVDGVATATFSSPEAGTFEVVVINKYGGPVLASTTITVVPPVVPDVVLTASPTTITLGQTSTLTVTGLDDGLNAIFAISTPVLPNNQGMINPEAVTIAGGTGVTTFKPNAAGTYVIGVATQYSEGPLANVTITVLAPPVVPTLPATGGEVSPWVVFSGIGALLLGAFLVTRAIAHRRPREN